VHSTTAHAGLLTRVKCTAQQLMQDCRDVATISRLEHYDNCQQCNCTVFITCDSNTHLYTFIPNRQSFLFIFIQHYNPICYSQFL